MTEIKFIDEDDARKLVQDEVKKHLDKGHIKSPEGFANHCIDTGKIAYDISKKILNKNPELSRKLNPDMQRVQGYMHDFSKAEEGDNYHEIGTAFRIVDSDKPLSEGGLGLVRDGKQWVREESLREMARITIPDYAVYEELGGSNFPDGALHKNDIGRFIDRVYFLMDELSKDGASLTMEQLALPTTLPQKVGLYADLTNVGGKIVSVSERLEEIKTRYSDKTSSYHNPIVAQLTEKITPRLVAVADEIEALI